MAAAASCPNRQYEIFLDLVTLLTQIIVHPNYNFTCFYSPQPILLPRIIFARTKNVYIFHVLPRAELLNYDFIFLFPLNLFNNSSVYRPPGPNAAMIYRILCSTMLLADTSARLPPSNYTFSRELPVHLRSPPDHSFSVLRSPSS